ncbi:hypothetical protein QBC42DRAFT_325456 [Cladorrhinum samala]|uniref:SET domain-containing protein n=1 Tax=Cladorrhinum samala TaxID=585594 RepID=A0AAV9HTD2_9PEZI|nr:hypothetical protein QBC42DRAFT_325456 [Cladorrhinum samala]
MEVDSDENTRFLDGSKSFLNWFENLPGATFHKEISIEDLRHQNAGRGIIAKSDIPADTVLFTIPRSSILCAATSPLKELIPEIFDLDNVDDQFDDDDDGDDNNDENKSPSQKGQNSWTLLILIMMYEHLRGEASPWKPYLDVLPSTFNTPMFWSPSELSALQSSALVSKVGKAEADAMIATQILPVIRSNPAVFFPPSSSPSDRPVVPTTDDELARLAHRMGSTIMAYAFDLESDEATINENNEADEQDEWEEDREGKTMLGMVPMADMLNADAEFNAHINHGEASLTAVSLRPIRAGEEILNFYGPLSSAELLRRYGYVTEKHARWDVVELAWEAFEARLPERFFAGDKLAPEQWAAVQARLRADDDFEEGFVLERYGPDPSPAGLLEEPAVFGGLPDELGEQLKLFFKAVKKVTGGSNGIALRALEDKAYRKEMLLETAQKALADREKQYGSSLEEDEQLLASGRLEGRERMAVWVRRGEKQVLREAQAWAKKELDEILRNKISEQSKDDEGRASKRRRF